MKYFILPVIFLATIGYCQGGPLKIRKRAAFYIANETACVVDTTVYSNGDPIPTDDPCESCRCRPPGFACVLKECEVKPGCRAVRRAGHCCPEYICGCEHNGRMYRDGDEIHDSQNPCYTCHCQGSSIACAFVDCFFRVDCAPEYIPGECCPHYTHCSSLALNASSEQDGSPFAFEKETTLSNALSSESTLQEELPQVSTAEEPYEETSKEEVNINESSETSESVTARAESLDALHFIYSKITEAPEIVARDQENNLNVQTTTVQPAQNEKSNEDADSNENKNPDEEIIPAENKPELTNANSELLNTEEINEKSEEFSAESSSESSISSGYSVHSETTAPNGNFEIFAADKESENDAEATTVSIEVQTDAAEITELSGTTKKEYEIETNNIEKRFRSLSNITSEKDSDSEDSESKEKLEDGKPEDIALTELFTPSAVQDEKDTSTSEENKETSASAFEGSSASEDSSEETDSKENTETTIVTKTTENLYYNSEEKSSTPQQMETVTFVVEVKEQTSPSVDDEVKASLTESGGVGLNLFKALDEMISEENAATEIQKDLPTSQKEEIPELSTESADYTSAFSSVSLADKLENIEIESTTGTIEEKIENSSPDDQTTKTELSLTTFTEKKDELDEKIQ